MGAKLSPLHAASTQRSFFIAVLFAAKTLAAEPHAKQENIAVRLPHIIPLAAALYLVMGVLLFKDADLGGQGRVVDVLVGLAQVLG